MLVTGVTSGLGHAIAKRFTSMGWTVIGLARDAKKLNEIQNDLGTLFIPYVSNISNAKQIEIDFYKILESHPKLDVLINNAGIFKLKNFEDCTPDDIGEIIDTNLKGAIYCTYFAINHIREGTGRIINISSVAGKHGIKNQAIYCASKFGLEGFGEALGQELQERNISLTTLSPGGMDTELWSSNNPYPGINKEKLLQPNDIVHLIEEIIQFPPNVVVKSITIFPSNEWH